MYFEKRGTHEKLRLMPLRVPYLMLADPNLNMRHSVRPPQHLQAGDQSVVG